jgi:hypothetical protein
MKYKSLSSIIRRYLLRMASLLRRALIHLTSGLLLLLLRIKIGFDELEFLGRGKDGSVYYSEKQQCTYKVMSPFTLSSKERDSILHQRVNSFFLKTKIRRYLPGVFRINQIRQSHFDVTSIDHFILILDDLKALMAHLAASGIYIWDFGHGKHNFMRADNGSAVWVDYSSSGFLFFDNSSNAEFNPLNSENEFLQIQYSLFLIKLFLKDPEASGIASAVRHKGEASFSYARAYIRSKFERMGFGFGQILETDFLSRDPLQVLINVLKKSSLNKTLILEDADITDAIILDGCVQVRGYQNYDLTENGVIPIAGGHQFAETKKKLALIDETFKPLAGEKSYLDIGSNLGAYVFHAALSKGWAGTGIDYNADYISVCRSIVKKLDVPCSFSVKGFDDIVDTYDVVTMMAVIHHIYGRTGNSKSLNEIACKLSEITNNHCIVEFPNEFDAKSRKWIGDDCINKKYSEKQFLASMHNFFPKVKKVGCVIKTRPIYHFSK